MNLTVDALQTLHRIHKQLRDVRDRLERGPKQIKAGESQITRTQAELKLAKDGLTQTRVSADEKQLQLRTREGRIKDLQSKLNASTSNREYQALKEQIAADEQASSVLSDEILEALERIDQLQIKVREADANLKKATEDLVKIHQRVAEQQPGLESELARLSAELAAAEIHLPEEIKANYLRIARVRGEDTMAPVEGDSCGGCFTTLTTQVLNEIYMLKPFFCKNCGRLLYLPEDRSKQ